MKKEILIFFGLVLLVNFVAAVSCPLPPSIPVTYYGNISYDGDGELIEQDYEIIAYVGDLYGSKGIVENGEYYIDISCYNGGGEISFFINGIEANEHPEFDNEEDLGKEINLDLTFYKIPPLENSCGDGIKDPGEVCDGTDFGELSCSNYGFNAGSLSCSEYCNNINIDNCYNSVTTSTSSSSGSSSGGGGGGGSGGSSGTTSGTITQTDNGDGTINLNLEPEKNETEGQEATSSGITGAVIGFVKSPGGIATGGLIVVFGVIAFFGFKKRKSVKKDSEEESKEESKTEEEEHF